MSVSDEYVPKGKGSVLAHVPTVEVRDSNGQPLRLKVDTFNEAPVYSVGQDELGVEEQEKLNQSILFVQNVLNR